MTQNKKPAQNHPPYIPEASAPYVAQATQSAAHTAETIAKIRETLPDFAKAQPRPAPALELSTKVVTDLNDLLLTIARIKELLG